MEHALRRQGLGHQRRCIQVLQRLPRQLTGLTCWVPPACMVTCPSLAEVSPSSLACPTEPQCVAHEGLACWILLQQLLHAWRNLLHKHTTP